MGAVRPEVGRPPAAGLPMVDRLSHVTYNGALMQTTDTALMDMAATRDATAGRGRGFLRAHGLQLALLALVLLAAALRWHRLGHESLWLDEILQSITAEGPLHELIARISQHAAAPADYLITRALLALGRQEFWLRFVATCFSILTVPLLHQLGRTLLSTPAALAAALLFAISPYALRFAQELRPYAAFAFWSILSTYVLVQALAPHQRVEAFEAPPGGSSALGSRPTRWRASGLPWWLAYVAVSAINLHTHLFALAVLAAHAAWLTLLALGSLLLGRRPTGREAWAWRWPRQRWVWAFAAMGALAAIALASPWLPGYVGAVASGFLSRLLPVELPASQAGTLLPPQSGAPERIDLEFLRNVYFLLGAGQTQGANWLHLGLATLGALMGLRRRPAGTTLLLLLAVAAPLLIMILLLLREARFGVHYLAFAQPAYLLLVGSGLATLGEGLGIALRRGRAMLISTRARPGETTAPGRSVVILGTTLAALVAAILTMPGLLAYYQWQREDWRGVSQILSQVVEPGDVFAAPGGLGVYVSHYWPQVSAYEQPAENAADLLQLAEEVGPGHRLWLLHAPYSPVLSAEPAQEWLQSSQALQLSFPPRHRLYAVEPGGDALAALETWVAERSLQGDPRWRRLLASAHRFRANSLLQAGDSAAAAASLTNALAYLEDDDMTAQEYLEAAQVYRQAGDFQTAIPLYQQSVELDPSNADARNALGFAYLRVGRFPDAQQEFEEAIEMEGDSFWGHYLLGEALRAQGQNAAALSAYETAREIDPSQPLAHQQIGDSLLRAGQAQEAVHAYRQGLAIAPADGNLMHGLALAQEASNDVASALASWKRYQEVAPNGPFAAEAASRIQALSQ